MKIIFILVLIIFWSAQLPASATDFDYFSSPSQKYNVPKKLIKTIAWVESGLKPWTLNIEGKSYRFASKKEALETANEAYSQ